MQAVSQGTEPVIEPSSRLSRDIGVESEQDDGHAERGEPGHRRCIGGHPWAFKKAPSNRAWHSKQDSIPESGQRSRAPVEEAGHERHNDKDGSYP